MCSWGETSPRFIWMGGFTPCTSLRAVHGATHGWHVSDVPLPIQHADTPQVVGTCHGMSPNTCPSGAAICACVSLCVTCHGMSADATPLISTALGDMPWHVPTTY